MTPRACRCRDCQGRGHHGARDQATSCGLVNKLDEMNSSKNTDHAPPATSAEKLFAELAAAGSAKLATRPRKKETVAAAQRFMEQAKLRAEQIAEAPSWEEVTAFVLESLRTSTPEELLDELSYQVWGPYRKENAMTAPSLVLAYGLGVVADPVHARTATRLELMRKLLAAHDENIGYGQTLRELRSATNSENASARSRIFDADRQHLIGLIEKLRPPVGWTSKAQLIDSIADNFRDGGPAFRCLGVGWADTVHRWLTEDMAVNQVWARTREQ